MENLKLQTKQAIILWVAGFKEACCLHRVVALCLSSKPLSVRTGQCFLLNGFIYLGSLLMLKSIVIPVLMWILPNRIEHLDDGGVSMTLYPILRNFLIQLYYIFWFYPLYIFSIVLSSIWYNDIAKHAYDAVRNLGCTKSRAQPIKDLPVPKSDTHEGRPPGFDGVILGIGEQVYSLLLLTVFFIEVFLTGFIPLVGRTANFLLLSWMYAYYCFEYKWNISELSLDKRLDFFESNWAFFLGFGSPCVLAIFFFSPLVSYGVMAILFPLFVLTAAGTQAEQVIDSVKESWGGSGPGKIHIFYLANAFSLKMLQFFPETQKKE